MPVDFQEALGRLLAGVLAALSAALDAILATWSLLDTPLKQAGALAGLVAVAALIAIAIKLRRSSSGKSAGPEADSGGRAKSGSSQQGIFISYARADDEPFVKRLYSTLASQGFKVWWDRQAMESRGRTFLQEIRDAIAGIERLLLVVGPSTPRSDYVRAEIDHALQFGKVITPILRLGDHSQIPTEVDGVHCVDFRSTRNQREALLELTRILSTPAPPLGRISAEVRPLTYFVSRPDDLQALKASLLADLQSPVVVPEPSRRIGLVGMGGVGKSLLATAVARNVQVRMAFPDGIFWLTLAPDLSDQQLTIRQSQLANALGDRGRSFLDVALGREALREQMEDKACLLVLDNVWQLPQIESFPLPGPRSRILLTTRDAGLVRAIGAVEHRIDVLGPERALMVLAETSGQPAESLPQEAGEIARECGRLPLALALSGALARDGTPWHDVLRALREADLRFLDHPLGSVLKSIMVSVDTLPRQELDRFLELAVLPASEAVPESVVLAIWQHTGRLSEHACRRLLATFSRRFLLRLETEPSGTRVALHDLIHDYLQTAARDPVALHGQLLDAYRARCTDGWASGPDDGHFFQKLHFHLRRARRFEELYALARDDRFAARQASLATNAASLRLQTIQEALEGALDTDNAAMIANLSLLHARTVLLLTQEPPLEAIGRHSLERVWALIDLRDTRRRIVWHLLLATALADARPSDSGETLARILSMHLPKLDGWQGALAQRLLPRQSRIDPHAFHILHHQLTQYDYEKEWLCAEVAANGDFDAAFRIAETAQDLNQFKHKSGCLVRIAQHQAKRGLDADAMATLARIADPDKRGEAQCEVAAAQAQRGSVDLALAMIAAVNDHKSRDAALMAIAEAQAKARDFKPALSTVQQMGGHWPKAWSYAVIAREGAIDGRDEAAKTTLQFGLGTAGKAIEEDEKKPDSYQGDPNDINASASFIAEKGTRANAQRSFFRAAAGASAQIAALDAGMGQPYHEYLKQGIEWAGLINLEDVRALAVADMAAVAIKAGLPEMTKEVLAKARQIAEEEDKYASRRPVTLAAIAEILSAAGAEDLAEQVLASALEQARTAHARGNAETDLIAVAESLLRLGKKADAFATFAMALDPLPNRTAGELARRSALAFIALRQAENGNADDARAIFLSALAAVPVQEHGCAELLATISNCQVRAGQFDDALRTAGLVDNPSKRVETLSDTVIAWAQPAKDAEGADKDKGKAKSLIPATLSEQDREKIRRALDAAVDTPEQRADAQAAIAEAYAAIGDLERAKGLFAKGVEANAAKADKLGSALNIFTDFDLHNFSHRQGRQKLVTDALDTIRRIQSDWIQSEATKSLVETMADWAKPAEVLPISRQPKLAASKAASLMVVADAYRKANDATMASELMAEALKTADKGWEVRLYQGWAQSRSGDARTAADSLEAACKNATAIQNEETRSEALQRIGVTAAEAGLGAQAAAAVTTLLTQRGGRYVSAVRETLAMLADKSDKASFRRLVVPAAHDLQTACHVCGLLLWLYNTDAARTAEIISALQEPPTEQRS